MEFLFDDAWVDRQAGVRRVVATPLRSPEPILQKEKPWEASGVGQLCGLCYDEQVRRFRMWYRTSVPIGTTTVKKTSAEPSERESAPRQSFLCYAESSDGSRWTRPALGRFEFRGSRDNNIVRELLAHRDTAYFNLIKDPADPNPARRYKALGFDTSRKSLLPSRPQGGTGLCVAYSADGLDWPAESTLVMDTADVTDADVLQTEREPHTGKWVAFLRPRTAPKRRFVGYAESSDFDHWTYPRMLLTPDHGDDEWIEFYGLAVARIGSWRIGGLWVFHNNPAFSPMTNELVYSRDGRDYQRAARGRSLVPRGGPGTFDSVMVMPRVILERGSECFIYYDGRNGDHGSDRGLKQMTPSRTLSGEPSREGIGLARLPWGHFCGLRADLDGMVETKYLCNYGPSEVRVAAALEQGGSIQAEILDQYGNVIPGWSRTESRTRLGERGLLLFYWEREELVGRAGQVSAKQGRVGHVVKLRFHLHQATLYGFQVGVKN